MTTETANLLALRFGSVLIAVDSDDAQLLERLSRYFERFVSSPRRAEHPHSVLTAVEDASSWSLPELTPWVVDGKEAFADMDGGRVVRKVRTGVTISIKEDQWSSSWTIRGRLHHNFSQVVNLIGIIYGLKLLDRYGAMIHASAVSDEEGRAIAIVGQSGMGKSSVAVRLLEQGFDFISNDRLILLPDPRAEVVYAHGLPKLPRVNPGTLLAGARTRAVLTKDAEAHYTSLSKEALWGVEDKHDLEVERVLGQRWLLSGALVGAFFLDWRQDGEGLDFQRLTPGQAVSELRAAAKDFGAFDLRLGERRDTAYVETARRVPMYRVTGAADPSGLARELAQGRLRDLA